LYTLSKIAAVNRPAPDACIEELTWKASPLSLSDKMTETTARIVVRQGPHPNRAFSLNQPKLTIGRSQNAGIRIPDPEVSRLHAHILRLDDTFSIEDLGSTNGTFVNGERITGLTPLAEGDLIDLGSTVRLVFLPELTDQPADFSMPYLGDEAAATVPEMFEPVVAEPALRIKDAQIEKTERSNRRRWLISCGCGLLLAIFICGAILFFLDSYEGGRLLYCGPLQSLFETILGPFGFSPACAVS
jgi:pSer/pThr/pTyr-binding forkhead associated (FHA) protein